MLRFSTIVFLVAVRAVCHSHAIAQEAEESPPKAASHGNAVIELRVWAIATAPRTMGDLVADALEGKEVLQTPAIESAKDVRMFVASLRDAGQLRKLQEVRIRTVAGHQAVSRSGTNEPRVIGTNITQHGRANTINYREVGTVIEALPIIESEGVLRVALNYEASYFKSDGGVPLADGEGRLIKANPIGTDKVNTIAKLKTGGAAIIWSDAVHEAGGDVTGDLEQLRDETRYVILAAEIVRD